MSEILGYDINGRPFRAGDYVVMVNAVNPKSIVRSGASLTVMQDAGLVESSVTGRIFEAFNPEEIPSFYAEYAAVRKLDNHQQEDIAETGDVSDESCDKMDMAPSKLEREG